MSASTQPGTVAVPVGPTPRLRPHSRHLWRRALGFGLIFLGWFPSIPSAQTGRLDVRVVWVNRDRVYLALLDSTSVLEGMPIAFQYRGRRIAEGNITTTHHGEFAFARVRSGSLAEATKLAGIRVLSSSQGSDPLRIFRLGYPAPSRVGLWFECATLVSTPSGEPGYRVIEHHPERFYRLVRESPPHATIRGPDHPEASAEGPTPWPDTLVIRFYDEAADEEIALERGELDAAVFWPGEASAHIRDVMGTPLYSAPGGGRGWVVLDAMPVGGWLPPIPLYAEDRARLLELNAQLFRGDLLLWELIPTIPPPSDVGARAMGSRPRFAVDRAAPGWQVIERFLNHPRGEPPRTGEPPLRLRYEPRGPRESQLLRIPLFEVRCPVLCAPAFRRYVWSLGPERLVHLLECPTPDGTR